MSLETLHKISRVMQFDNCDTRASRREWLETLPLLYDPGPHLPGDQRLVPLRGR